MLSTFECGGEESSKITCSSLKPPPVLFALELKVRLSEGTQNSGAGRRVVSKVSNSSAI